MNHLLSRTSSLIVQAIFISMVLSVNEARSGLSDDEEKHKDKKPCLIESQSGITNGETLVQIDKCSLEASEAQGQGSQSASLRLAELSEKIRLAVRSHSTQSILKTYKASKSIESKENFDDSPKDLVPISTILPWEGSSLAQRVLGQLFFEASVNPPHQELLKNALLSLRDVSEGDFDTVYEQSRANIETLVIRHHYLRRTGGVWGLVAASKFRHPIARLVLMEIMRQIGLEEKNNTKSRPGLLALSEEEKQFLETQHQEIKKTLKASRKALECYLEESDERFQDLDPKDMENDDQLAKKEALGLPLYTLLRGQLCNKHQSSSVESCQNALEYYKKAGEAEDLRGFVWIVNLVNGALRQKIFLQDASSQHLLQKAQDQAAFLGYRPYIDAKGPYSSHLVAVKDLKTYLEKEL